MAGGKLTPRQKMINLMYLVFIAMLAMNMSKEVLSAFGLMNERFESANTSATNMNEQMLAGLDEKAKEDAGHFGDADLKAHKVADATKKFFTFIGSLKAEVLKGVEIEKESGKLPYESMDKGDNIDNSWFVGEGYSPRGIEIIKKIENYKSEIKNAVGNDSKYVSILKEVDEKFNVSDVKNKEGLKVKFLEYHFDKFPSIASLAKLSAWQNDVKKTEADIYSSLLGKAAVAAASMNTFKAIVVLEKNVYFEGEAIKGSVVLGKYDANTHPTGFNGPGRIENGQAVISMTAGGVGEHDLGGSFTFLEDKKNISIPFKGTYVVVPRPKSANIAADKMNVVYRGVANPMTISFAGVPNNSVNASAPGLSSNGNGTYTMNPQGGTEVTINVNAKLPDGKSVSDAKVFRIKNVPSPMGGIGKETGIVKGAKSRLEVSQVSAELKDFPFDLTFVVKQFAFKVPGQPTIIVNGDRVNGQCKSALLKAVKGDQITISDIKTVIPGSAIVTPKTGVVIYELQ
jgi:gliding motility-associated protein GldM